MNPSTHISCAFVFLTASLLASSTFAQVIPTISCSSLPSLFNTASDGAGGALTSGSDMNWQFAYGGAVASPTPMASLTWQLAAVKSPFHPSWMTAPAGSGWISNQASGASISSFSHLTHYRYDFTLSPQVVPSSLEIAMDLYVDNYLLDVQINGNTFMTYPSPGTGGFGIGNGTSLVLKNQGSAQWQAGLNSILITVRDDGGSEGFLATNGTFAQCTSRSFGQTTAVPATNPATIGLLAAGLLLAGAGWWRRQQPDENL